MRHAKAEPHGAAPDAARRLTPEGRARFERLLQALGPRLAVARIVTSPFARARETAALLARVTGAPVVEDASLASGHSDGRALLALLEALGPGTALVGHNPEVADAVALVADREEQVRPGTIAALRRDGTGLSLAWLETPGRE